MNLNLNKEEARLVSDAITYFFSKVPDLLLDLYPEADVKDILSQLNYIIELGEEPLTEAQKNLFKKKGDIK